MELSGPGFITLLVRDLEASRAFYKDKLGLAEASEVHPNAQAFLTEPCGFAIRLSPAGSAVSNPGAGIIIWWRSSDATALHEALQKRGVPIVGGLKQGPFGKTFSFRDPDGYVMTVHDGG